MSLMDRVSADRSLPELLCQDAHNTLPISAAGIALMDANGVIEMTVGSDERASALEELQISMGEGPCMDAFATGRLAFYPDISAQGVERWPGYARAVLDLGVEGVFSFPLNVGGIHLGALDLFRDESGRLDDDDLRRAFDYVDVAVLILIHLQAIDPHNPSEGAGSRVDRPLDLAFRGHAEVHQATGMVAIQAGVGLTEALLLLRAHAFADDRSITEVARDVVARLLSFD